jgi:hypothetical protein
MDHYELGVALATSRIAELRRQADRWRLARVAASCPGPESDERAMPVQHQHQPGLFDPGHCRGCARQAGLLDHYCQVQQQEASLRQAHRWALAASRRASVALWSAGASILLAIVALLRG